MISAGAKRLALILPSAIFLAACEEGSEFKLFEKPLFEKSEAAEGAAVERTASGAVIEKDVEAPDVFQQAEAGLWDGRPSLGGVWVAHPDVIDPDRVMIRNETNGNFVIGALFRRERDNPGPRFQVSSDAASALGMLAGAPGELNVVALRRQQVEVVPDQVIPVAEPVETQTIKETNLDTATEPDPAGKTDSVAKMAESAIAAAAAAGAPPKDAIKPTARPNPTSTPAAPIAAPAKSSLEKPFVQIGIFSIQTNADRTAEMLRQKGVIPTIKHSSTNGKEFWRVIVGPLGSAAGRSSVIKKVKALGFTDAYAVTN